MSARGPRTRLLVVDDEPDFLRLMTQRLTSWGYEALTATSASEGWRLAKEQLPDLILLDVMMPKMKGRELCELLKAHPQTRDIPVMLLTALGLPDHIKAGLDAGAEDYLVKPFDPEDLKDRIKVCLQRHSRQPP